MTEKNPNNVEKGKDFTSALAGTTAGGMMGSVTGALVGSFIPVIGTATGAKFGAQKGADLGTNIGRKTNQVISNTNKQQGILLALQDPMNYLVDQALKLIIDFIIPVPMLGEYSADIIIKYKGEIITTIIAVLLTIYVTLSPKSLEAGTITNHESLPSVLHNYIEIGFTNNSTPIHSPFGGKGTESSYITAYFNDPDYFSYYGKWHKAIDIIPNNYYWQNNNAYKKYKKPVMFATCSGEAKSRIDKYGANIVEIDCNDGIHEVWYVHNKLNFVPEKEVVSITAGQPIAVMGATGLADGAHVHYAILKNGTFVNPINYFNK